MRYPDKFKHERNKTNGKSEEPYEKIKKIIEKLDLEEYIHQIKELKNIKKHVSSKNSIRKHYDKYLITYNKYIKKEDKENATIELVRMIALLNYDSQRRDVKISDLDKKIINALLNNTLKALKEGNIDVIKKYKTMYEILMAYSKN